MASEAELVEVLRESLESDGTLNKMKSEMTSNLVRLLDTDTDSGHRHRPAVNRHVALVNSVVREYLQWSNYKYTEAMLCTESGMSSEQVPRSRLLSDLGIADSDLSSQLPVLIGLLSTLQVETTSELKG